ncbi:MAG TPA: SOS response-associated peptidase family protein [Flavobacterium sp.]|jgi:putative SOS response-associated peptidase YedK
MCKRVQFQADINEVAKRFSVSMVESNPLIQPQTELIGFDHPFHPVIKADTPDTLSTNFQWGLIPPDWNKLPNGIWNHTVNAKLEYLSRRYSWSKVTQNRCLVPVTAYYEFHWNDPKGKSKTKFVVKNFESEIFALAGLHSAWTDKTGKVYHTFTICTTRGNETMEFVHNKDAAKDYHRMPVMFNKEDERYWLDTSLDYMDFAYPNYKPKLVAAPVEGEPAVQLGLF